LIVVLPGCIYVEERNRTMSKEMTKAQAKAVAAMLRELGQAEGAQGITQIAENGYKADVPQAVLDAFDGDERHARGHIRSAAYDIYACEDFER
jgi:hypothetical protein